MSLEHVVDNHYASLLNLKKASRRQEELILPARVKQNLDTHVINYENCYVPDGPELDSEDENVVLQYIESHYRKGPKFFSDPHIYSSDGTRREGLIKLINKRTEMYAAECGIKMSVIDEETGLYINPLAVADSDLWPKYKGGLGLWGWNQAVDLKIIRRKNGIKEVLTQKRPQDPGEPLCVPGGMVDRKGFWNKEKHINSAIRKNNEILEDLDNVVLTLQTIGDNPILMKIKIKKMGTFPVADPRNGRLSSMMTTVFEAEILEGEDYLESVLENTREANEIKFRPVTGRESIVNNSSVAFFADHRDIIRGE